MILFFSSWTSLFLLRHIIFRNGTIRGVILLSKYILSKKQKLVSDLEIAAYTHKRGSENRVYGVIRNQGSLEFFKIAEDIFKTDCIDEVKLTDIINSNGERLIDSGYKHRILTREEFEKLGYGVDKGLYHGDISKGNVFIKNDDVILIDNEFEKVYPVNYQNLDYLINALGNKRSSFPFEDLEWWLAALSIYTPITMMELIEMFEMRKDNGCDLAINILKKSSANNNISSK